MKKYQQLAHQVSVAFAVAAIVGTSAFADSRHSNETRTRREEGGAIRRQGEVTRSNATRRDKSSNASDDRRATVEQRSSRPEARSDARVEVRADRNSGAIRRDAGPDQKQRSVASAQNGRSEHFDRRGGNDSYRSNAYSGGNGSERNHGRHGQSRHYTSHGHAKPYFASGRVTGVRKHGHGYRVWVAGAPYPYYVPLAYWNPGYYRVGVSIHLGGYYNPRGYYDYYDPRSAGAMRGVVESVDFRRDTFVVRNDATGSFVTVVSRDRWRDVRPGDWVELEGEWTRHGYFSAWDVDLLRAYLR